MQVPRFEEMTVQRPDLGALRAEAAARVAAWSSAEGADAQEAIIRAWDRGRFGLGTSASLAHIHFAQDTASEAAQAEQRFFDDVEPDLEALDVEFLGLVTQSAHREALERRLGSHAFALWELFVRSFDPRIADAKRAESKLRAEYDSLMASVSFEVDGQRCSLSTVRALWGDADRGVRERAVAATSAALGEQAPRLDALYDELVQVRDEMAQAMGYPSYTGLAYHRLSRTDYGPDEVAVFRQQILDEVVPLANAVYARQAERLGVDAVYLHDEGVPDLRGVPKPNGDRDWLVARGAELYAALGDDFGEFFAMLNAHALMDLESREGKRGGGFCDGLTAHGVPFIFANFNGTQDDVNVFTHECGHAFQFFQAAKVQPLSDYFWPTMEAAEICSMSLEYLSYPHMELFFGDDAERYRLTHLESALTFLPYGALVDHFQHEVYAAPELSPEERAALWGRLEAIYMPHRRYAETPYFAGGRRWQRQGHIYGVPFYYIDYCLALACALQLWARGLDDRAGAMATYRELAKLGGSRSFSGLLEAVGLESPMKPGTLSGVVEAARRRLGL